MLKKTAVSALNYINSYKLIRQHRRAIDKKLAYLKSKNLLKKYPLGETRPLISQYPFFSKKDIKWLDFFYSIYGKADEGVIPLSSYYTVIEPCLNNRLMISTIKDKNFYELFIKDIKTPHVLLRRINQQFYDRSYRRVDLDDPSLIDQLRGEEQIIVKSALFSGSGRSIAVFKRVGDRFLDDQTELTTAYLRKFGPDYVVQRFVKQHEYYRQFNPHSNNTLRVLTYRSVKDDQIHILHTLLRIGKKGSFLDHDNLGGVSIAIDDNNNLHDHALDINGNKITSFNDIVFSQMEKAACLDEVKSTAKKLAELFFHGRLLAMDFTVSDSGDPLLLEINCWGNGISQYQMSNGSVFREFTQEVLDYCAASRFYNVLLIPNTTA